MTDEIEPDVPVQGAAAGVGGASSGSSTSSPENEKKEVNLQEFAEKCTREARWFLKVLVNINDAFHEKEEIRLYRTIDGKYISATTYGYGLSFGLEIIEKNGQKMIRFSFFRVEDDCDDGEKIGDLIIEAEWEMPVMSGKEIIDEFWDALLTLPLGLEQIIERVEKLDKLVRKEKALVYGKEITLFALKDLVER
jgi:hypothetical protein